MLVDSISVVMDIPVRLQHGLGFGPDCCISELYKFCKSNAALDY